MPSNIDYDRGVYIKVEQSTGIDVFMYVDEPGIFRNAYGTEVSAELAAKAGYDVNSLLKDRQRRERIAIATAAIEAELNDDSKPVNKTIKEIDGFKVIDIGLGRHQVADPEGNILTDNPVPKEQAMLLLEHLTGGPKKPKAKAKEASADAVA